MNHTDFPYRFLYVSRLAPHCSPDVVGTLLTLARERNQQLGIHGALLYDGERFVQCLEGPRGIVQALARRIESDARHVDLTVLLEGAGDQPRFDRWVGGWTTTEALQTFLVAGALSRDHWLDTFQSLVGESDTA
jgi:Sensors of blue-light using FAD